jgi:tetratricopeptide (TPR) repeat protein
MQAILQSSQLSPEKNVYLYYALGKELEDLERWDEAFTYIEKAGKAALSVSDYDVGIDVELIDKMIEVCSPDWLADGAAGPSMDNKTPIFIVGLPRTGTTLTERILSCHSMVESVGESYFIQIAIKEASRVSSQEHMTAAMVEAAASKDIQRIAKSYTNAIKYRFGNKPFYIEKFPENFLYLGFIAKAFPNAKIIHLNRNPMDSCFAMFKQSFFRYAYSLDDLGPYYLAYHRLHKHWNELLGEQLIEVHYEELVSDQEDTTRRLLTALGLDFEEACLHFEDNVNASNTASTVQIRQKIHTRSVNRWKCFEKQLQSLKRYLEDAGIPLSEEQSGRVN